MHFKTRLGFHSRSRNFQLGQAANVVLNQVLVSFGDPVRTQRVIEPVQEDGTCWAGMTVWQGRTAMRISVSCWATTGSGVDRSVDAIIRCARAHPEA